VPSQIDKVMIVGFPPNWIRYANMAAHWSLAQLEAKAALIEWLDRAGFQVLYKAHPEFEVQTRTLFEGMSCTFVGGHFEKCWKTADAFVFPRISSTSFGFALCTNRPVVVLDIDGQAWRHDAYELLARRCRMVPAVLDDRLRIRFDANALVAALRQPVQEIDYRFVDEAMCA
jgi:hypothetical protein